MDNLFITSELLFEKLAGTTMPEDPNKWPQEIIQELFKQVPFISDFQPHMEMQKVDAERSYGFGHVVVSNKTEIQQNSPQEAQSAAGVREVRIPVVIREGMLLPLDLLVTDDAKVLPLTESRLRSAIFRPQMFDVTSKTPGDLSMIGQLYPPYRQNYGFGGGGVAMSAGMGKEGSALEEYLSKESSSQGTDEQIEAVLKEYPENEWGYNKEEIKNGLLNGRGPWDWGPKKELIPPKKHWWSRQQWPEPHYPQYDKSKTSQYAPTKKTKKSALEDIEKNSSVLSAILPTINNSDIESFKTTFHDEEVKLAYEQNAAAVLPSVKLLLEREEKLNKFASIADLVMPTVVQISRVDGGYKVKMASHKLWNPTTQFIDRGTALQQLDSKVVLAADLNGAATFDTGAEAVTPEESGPEMAPVTEAGMYIVQTDDGQELKGFVFPSLIDETGKEVPIALFTNGEQSSVQSDILGVPIEGDLSELPQGDAVTGHGVFYDASSASDDGELKATVPLTIASSFSDDPNQPSVFMAETFDGKQVQVSRQPNLQTVTATPDGRMLVPEHWPWMSLGESESVSLAGTEDELEKESQAKRKFASVQLIGDGSSFTVRGIPVSKLASDQREFLDVDDAMFLLTGLGVNQEHGIQKLAEASTGRAPVDVMVSRYLTTPAELKKEASARALETAANLPVLRRVLFKEAAVITDPSAVDTVLSLGFINPENITTFVNYLPELETSQAKLCELLFAARLGLSETPEGALEKAVRATEEVLEGLKSLAFQEPASYS